jgi:hypothetical protein
MEEVVLIDPFTLADKYQLILNSIFLLVLNIIVFLKLKAAMKNSKYQIKSKTTSYIGATIIGTLIFTSFFLIILPHLNEKTLKTDEVLSEGYVGENVVFFEKIENAHYPKYENGTISWYTVKVKDERYRESVTAEPEFYIAKDDTFYVNGNESSSVVYRTDDQKLLVIHEMIGTREYRGTDAFSYWYSFILVIYNIIVAVALYPLLYINEEQVRFIWKAQYEVSTIFIAIFISQVLLF